MTSQILIVLILCAATCCLGELEVDDFDLPSCEDGSTLPPYVIYVGCCVGEGDNKECTFLMDNKYKASVNGKWVFNPAVVKTQDEGSDCLDTDQTNCILFQVSADVLADANAKCAKAYLGGESAVAIPTKCEEDLGKYSFVTESKEE